MKLFPLKHGSSRGYTLIEFVVVMVLVAIMAGFMFRGTVRAIEIYITSTRDYLEFFQEGKIALEKMAREIRETDVDGIDINPDIAIMIFKKEGHTTPQDPNLIITYALENGILRRNSVGGSFALFNDVDSFSPTQDANGVVTLDLTASRGECTVHLRTAVYPRQPGP